MASIMFRDDWQKLARLRVREAKKLLDARLYPGAYHFSGLSIECAIKACIAKRTREFQYPDKDFAASCFSHKLTSLIVVAELQQERNTKANTEPTFDSNWAVVKDWNIESRYEHEVDKVKAMAIYSAVVSRQYGVLQWLRQHW